MKVQKWMKSNLLAAALFLAAVSPVPAAAAPAPVFADQGVGSGHSLLLYADGTVWSMGTNVTGQLGIGNTIEQSVPHQVYGLTDIVSVSSGVNFSLALQSDGTVWSWGTNNSGQLGDGTRTRRTKPVKVAGLTGVTAISAGNGHSLALKSDGTVWAWGSNGSGELGDGTNTERVKPVKVTGLTGITAISCGNYHSVALKSDGTVWTFGSNIFGQIGDGRVGMQYNVNRPTAVAGLSSITHFKAGIGHTIAVRSDGTVWAWGDNSAGQLGDGTKTRRTKAIRIPGLTGFAKAGAGGYSSFALRADGSVWAWGNNNGGQLGIGTAGDTVLTMLKLTGSVAPLSESPKPRQMLTGVQELSVQSQHTFARMQDGTVWAWGKNEFGQIGDGTKVFRVKPSLYSENKALWQY